MPELRIKSIQDAVAALREVASFLESARTSSTEATEGSKPLPKREAKQDSAPVDVIALSQSIRSLPRPELIETLSKLSTATLRSLCYRIGLKGMSKRPKDELIQAIVRELIDFAEEHRRLRTFSQRKAEET